MPVIKLTQQRYETIDRTKTGPENQRLIKEEKILFQTNKMITATPREEGGSTIRFAAAMVDSFYCKETIDEIQSLIQAQK